MSLINTKYFEQMEYDSDLIFDFSDGIPGFPDLHKFIVINEGDSVFTYLQSVEDESICFIMINPFSAFEDYDIEISEESVNQLGIKDINDVMIYSIVTVPEKISEMTANLRAPIILNVAGKKGLQEILNNEKYTTKHRIIKGE